MNKDDMVNITAYLHNKKVLLGGGIVILLLLPLILFSMRPSSYSTVQPTSPTPFTQMQTQAIRRPTPTPPLTAVLSFKPESATSTAVVVDTQNKPVTAIQLAISFDPGILGNVAIKPGDFFTNALVLMNKIDYSTGTIFYAAVLPPAVAPQQGKGVVAWLTYTFAPGSFNPTTLQFLPNTKVTARGIETSVLKEASSINIASTTK